MSRHYKHNACADLHDPAKVYAALTFALEDLQRQQATLRAALDHISQGLCVFDRDQRFVSCNQLFRSMYGMPARLLKPGTPYREFIAHAVTARDLASNVDLISDRLEFVMEGASIAKTHVTGDGRRIAIQTRGLPGGGWVLTCEDVTERIRAEERSERLAHQALHDPLTGLPNRAAFCARIGEGIERAARENTTFALLALDLDHFKEVNDHLGHPAGDALLCEVADRLRAAVQNDFVARLGGDEFMILCSSGNQPLAAEALAERILAAMAGEVLIAGEPLRIGASIGIAIYPIDDVERDHLVNKADLALYRAKRREPQQPPIAFFHQKIAQWVHERRLQHRSAAAGQRPPLSAPRFPRLVDSVK